MNAPGAQIRVRGAAELIAVIPHQFGYQPRQSLVVVLLGQPSSEGGPAAGALLMTMRVDVPTPETTEEVVDGVREVLAREQPFGVQLLAFTDDREDEQAVQVLRLLGQACADEGVVVDLLAQASGGFWCRRTRLHEPAVRPSWARVPEAADVPAAADLVLRGSSPLADRDAYGRALDVARPLTHQAVEAEILRYLRPGDGPPDGWDEWDDVTGRACQVWGAVLRTSATATPVDAFSVKELARSVWSLWDVQFRDCVLARVAPDQFRDLDRSATGPVTAARYRELHRALGDRIGPEPVDLDVLSDRLVALCSRTPRHRAAPVLTILGVHAWAKGGGTLANVAVERALTVDPDYRLAQLLDQALVAVIRPRRFAQVWQAHGTDQDPDAA